MEVTEPACIAFQLAVTPGPAMAVDDLPPVTLDDRLWRRRRTAIIWPVHLCGAPPDPGLVRQDRNATDSTASPTAR
jgi:hypothetical protein